jgi:hypothetical protein
MGRALSRAVEDDEDEEDVRVPDRFTVPLEEEVFPVEELLPPPPPQASRSVRVPATPAHGNLNHERRSIFSLIIEPPRQTMRWDE